MIATVTATKRPRMRDNIVANLKRQMRKPDLVVLVSHHFEIVPIEGFRCVVAQAPDDHVHGQIMDTAMTLASALMPDGMMCAWDDDDEYGAGYLEEVEATMREHPDAILIGKASYWAETVLECGGVIDRKLMTAGASKEGRARGLAGPTVCINSRYWMEHPNMRYDSLTVGGESHLIQSAYSCWQPPGDGLPWAPFYTTGTDNFTLRRYREPGHCHGWLGFQ